MKAKKEAYEMYAFGAASALSDAVMQRIVEKAKKYDITTFSNPDLLAHLCDTSKPPCRLSSQSCTHVATLLEWLIQSQNTAQLSSDFSGKSKP